MVIIVIIEHKHHHLKMSLENRLATIIAQPRQSGVHDLPL